MARQPTQADINPVINALNTGQFAHAEALAKKTGENIPQSISIAQLIRQCLGKSKQT
jgi:hypothetical protein